MPTDLTDDDSTFPTTVSVPAAGEPRTAASVQPPFQTLADRTAFNKRVHTELVTGVSLAANIRTTDFEAEVGAIDTLECATGIDAGSGKLVVGPLGILTGNVATGIQGATTFTNTVTCSNTVTFNGVLQCNDEVNFNSNTVFDNGAVFGAGGQLSTSEFVETAIGGKLGFWSQGWVAYRKVTLTTDSNQNITNLTDIFVVPNAILTSDYNATIANGKGDGQVMRLVSFHATHLLHLKNADASNITDPQGGTIKLLGTPIGPDDYPSVTICWNAATSKWIFIGT